MTQHRSVVGKRVYDAAGDLLQRHFREYFDGTFTDPDNGPVVSWTQHDTVVHNLGVPGDLASGATMISGLGTRAWVPSGGTVLTDAGTALIDSAADEVVTPPAHHPFDVCFRLGDASALAPLCAAVA